MVSIVEKNDVEKRGFRGVNGTIPTFLRIKRREKMILMYIFTTWMRKRVY